MKKILNINHCDLDALGCEFLLKEKFGYDNVITLYCNYKNVNKVLYDILKNGSIDMYDYVYITDISISEKMANWVDKSYSDKVILIDHHVGEATKHLLKYNWCFIQEFIKNTNIKTSATRMVAEHFNMLNSNKVIDTLIEKITNYDTWRWNEIDDFDAKKINDLFYIIGMKKLLDDFQSQAVYNEDYILPSKYEFLLELREEEYKHYYEACEKRYTVKNVFGYNVGFVIAERFISELGNDLAKSHPEEDFIAIVNLKTGISLRSIREDIHLGDIAKKWGEQLGITGGGHPKSAAITISTDITNQIIEYMCGGNLYGRI